MDIEGASAPATGAGAPAAAGPGPAAAPGRVPGEFGTAAFARGERLFGRGDPGGCAYLIERGSVDIVLERDGRPVVIGRRGPGEVIGEMSIIDDKPRSATAIAAEPCELLVITRELIAGRLERADPVLRLCLVTVLERFRETLGQLHAARAAAAGVAALAPAPAEEAGAPSPAAAPVRAAGAGEGGRAVSAIRLEQDLRRAIRAGEFELHYQPIVELEGERLAGFEALIRWRHRARGLIPPGGFIPAAEESGLIVPLSRWALHEACAGLGRLIARLPADAADRPFVSVNLSAKDLVDPDILPTIDSALGASGLPPHAVKLEITESALMSDADLVARILDACKARGLGISIDDFGTGYSNLGYLHRFPIDCLKIDRSFVQGLAGRDRAGAVVPTIVGLAERLRIPVVAEGVETAEQAAALSELGCRYAQGYLYGRPLPEAAALELLLGGADPPRGRRAAGPPTPRRAPPPAPRSGRGPASRPPPPLRIPAP